MPIVSENKVNESRVFGPENQNNVLKDDKIVLRAEGDCRDVFPSVGLSLRAAPVTLHVVIWPIFHIKFFFFFVQL